MLKNRYNFVGGFPEGWGIECPSTKPAGAPASEPEPGALQWAGAFFCPAVLAMIKGHRTPKMEHLLDNDQFRLHHKRLRRILPYLMGYNSRPFYAQGGHGRPVLGRSGKQVVKIKLVCPAAMGSVKCPLIPESMRDGAIGVPVVEPTWQVHERGCCANSSVMVTLTPEQFKRALDGPRRPSAVHRPVCTKKNSVERNEPNGTSGHRMPVASESDELHTFSKVYRCRKG